MEIDFSRSEMRDSLANKYLKREWDNFTETLSETLWAILGFALLVAAIGYYFTHAVVAVAERNL